MAFLPGVVPNHDKVLFGALGDVVTSDPSTPEIVNHVANLNGDDQWWLLTETITIPSGAKIRFKMAGVTEVSYISEILFGENESETVRTRLYLSAADSRPPYIKAKGDVVGTVDGVDMNESYPLDGLVHQVELTVNDTYYVKDIGSRDGTPTYFLKGSVFEFEVEVNGVVTHSIPLNNKEQGAIQLASVGNVNATMPNYNIDVWSALE